MLQRIQSLYLTAATILLVLLFSMPIAEVSVPGNQFCLIRMAGVFRIVPGGTEQAGILWWPLLILLVVIIILLLAAVLLYRKRMVQIRLCTLVILLLAGMIGLAVYYILIAFKDIGASAHSFRISVVFPLIAMILTYLAFRAIRKDEELVRSVDRIR
jgi:hypothetical protein